MRGWGEGLHGRGRRAEARSLQLFASLSGGWSS